MTLAQDLITKEDCTLSELVDGEVRVNYGDARTGEGEGASVSLWGNGAGFVSMPNQPDDEGAAQVLVHRDGNDSRVLATKDNRYIGAYGALAHGDNAAVTRDGTAWFMKAATKTIASYVVGPGGISMVDELNGKEGRKVVQVGKSIVAITDESITFSSNGTTVLIDADGFFVFGKHCGLNTNGGNLGTLGTIPPVPGAFSIVYGPILPAGTGAFPSTKWTIAG